MTRIATPPTHARAGRSSDALRRFLERARRTWWRVALGRALVVAAVAAAAVLPLWWAQRWSEGAAGRLAELGAAVLAPPLVAVFMAVALLAVALAAARAPSLLELARRADRSFGQAQRLSTSFELRTAPTADSIVVRALHDEVERRLPLLDAAAVGRPPATRWSPALVGVGLLLGLGAWFAPVPERAVAVADGTVVAAATAPTEADADALRRFAAVLAEVAEAEDRAYLRAVATSFGELAERVVAGALDAEAAERALEELLGHLEAAAGEVSSGFADAVRTALDEGGPMAGAPAGDAGGATEAAAGAGGGEGPTSGEAPRVDAAAVAADASLYMALADLANELSNDPASLGLRPPRPAFIDLDAEDAFYGGVGRAATDPNAAPTEPSGLRADAPGAGEAVGAAERSSERAGDAAGGGRADLGGGADGFLELEADGTVAAALPWNEREDGRYVEVELVPDAATSVAARDAERPASAGAFDRADEAASTARSIGAAYREVVGRYFMPGAVQAAGGAP